MHFGVLNYVILQAIQEERQQKMPHQTDLKPKKVNIFTAHKERTFEII